MSEPDIYDPEFVRDVFDRCSEKYIAFSTVCSLGFTEIWRRQCAEMLKAIPNEASGYDLMAGTGEVWPHLLRQHPQVSEICAVDISSGMHNRAIARMESMTARKVTFIADDVFNSDLPDNSADFIISTFGLKTFNLEQQNRLAKLTARVLKPGGQFAFIEASDPKGWILRPLYLFHLRTFLPLIEKTLLRGAQDFAMIGTYSSNFGNASAFKDMLEEAGLDAKFRRFFFGCATGAYGIKPSAQ